MDWNFVHRTLRPIRSKLVAFTKQESLEYQETDEVNMFKHLMFQLINKSAAALEELFQVQL